MHALGELERLDPNKVLREITVHLVGRERFRPAIVDVADAIEKALCFFDEFARQLDALLTLRHGDVAVCRRFPAQQIAYPGESDGDKQGEAGDSADEGAA